MKYVLLILLLAATGVVIFSNVKPRQQKPASVASTSQTFLATQTNTEGPVTIEATPIDVPEGKTWKFKIALNTHSDELSQDLIKSVTLEDDRGNSYKPASWEGSPPGGHHREGKLIFNPVSPKPKRISLIVKNIGGVAERNFLWKLE